ncbi:hypothetical protein FJ942_28040 [Mesorhizobium sp. B2-4-2]|uniref:hypothetical protein n=1 Tax=unclassified Mesorhizobium TaxID=325217 RepID=UPI00112D6A53|nr:MULTISPECIES: hypothetical protein [unclassified Mesorhizobium]MBZ9920447.1 hypothetical protein [Mesorhizobium sp. BR1-1-7]MBZ9956488.1 hypothetical protein [Mesorhizobium sp. BR1-1-15]MBZ9961903.1 hypothetical protein [Mesorhizobium sp. BR1-1-14]MBZ9973706.1 hypothetical protein [Mesorhizobium sp. BR1-1-12]TPL42337.1 hypothetical protein FJ937_28230 [Mesorhizobium sp. B2-4-4]
MMFLTDLLILALADESVARRALQGALPGAAIGIAECGCDAAHFLHIQRWMECFGPAVEAGTVIGLAIDNEVARSSKARMQAKGNINGYA